MIFTDFILSCCVKLTRRHEEWLWQEATWNNSQIQSLQPRWPTFLGGGGGGCGAPTQLFENRTEIMRQFLKAMRCSVINALKMSIREYAEWCGPGENHKARIAIWPKGLDVREAIWEWVLYSQRWDIMHLDVLNLDTGAVPVRCQASSLLQTGKWCIVLVRMIFLVIFCEYGVWSGVFEFCCCCFFHAPHINVFS